MYAWHVWHGFCRHVCMHVTSCDVMWVGAMNVCNLCDACKVWYVMHACVHVCMYACMCMCCIYVCDVMRCVYVFMHACMHACMYTFHLCMYFMCVCMYCMYGMQSNLLWCDVMGWGVMWFKCVMCVHVMYVCVFVCLYVGMWLYW